MRCFNIKQLFTFFKSYCSFRTKYLLFYSILKHLVFHFSDKLGVIFLSNVTWRRDNKHNNIKDIQQTLGVSRKKRYLQYNNTQHLLL